MSIMRGWAIEDLGFLYIVHYGFAIRDVLVCMKGVLYGCWDYENHKGPILLYLCPSHGVPCFDPTKLAKEISENTEVKIGRTRKPYWCDWTCPTCVI